MRILFTNNQLVSPLVSIILLDWSCRESFHVLDYLEKQTIPRNRYEIIWIEYYGRRAAAIEEKLRRCAASHKPPALDQWVVMDMPESVYYHKHLMYNVGLLLSRGRILTVCDSDAMVRSTFVEAIIHSFERDSNIVLHMDEVRNNSRRFYPFNYPSIEEVTADGCINWEEGKTTGLRDTTDVLHTRNYGACMAALRADLVNIGGADEHVDYLGHVCGPYEMTFRLVNSGKREVWHAEEFLYHVWHPGQAGAKNYLGPHDGRHVSTRALEARRTGRVLPFKENVAVKTLRTEDPPFRLEELLDKVVPRDSLESWSTEDLAKRKPSFWCELRLNRPSVAFGLFSAFLKMLARSLQAKVAKALTQRGAAKEAPRKVMRSPLFLKAVWESNLYAIQRSSEKLRELVEHGHKEVSLYGTGVVADVVLVLAREFPVRIRNVYHDESEGESRSFHSFRVLPVETSASGSEKLIVASLVEIEGKVDRLKALGVEPERIVVLQ